ncbi:DUF4105 domain-containing protein [Pseudoduganella sp. DS3]|uniref:DUF4105 domain-containing protein n=1 Tax=Pseudoduganella guangdongensis TaxID=2692179 RepID=A0A6N9HME6_9BURK|nr:DUF4105 domain-containing protein [Pseudoduganella guangdongensis]MYN04861.1 DUF4105 domain-containing protein [Pseudoduganella guangdongensis]
MNSKLFPALLLGAASPAMAQLPDLALNQDWQRLLIYEADAGSPSGLRSAIHSPEFFLAAHGATDPGAELHATLQAMRAPATGDNDTHAKCRFPARRLWLAQRLPAHASELAEIDCPAFQQWARPAHVDSVSLVFANGYLGNPASYYGHTFLKFNHSKASATPSLLDSTLNYGALLANQDNPVSYIVKGLTGGYDGGFSPIEFYFHDATYGETELRDMWEYRLALPEHALRLVVAHAWEVTQKKYTYYFLRLNCAYRVAELLEIANGIDIIPRNRPWVMPQALLQKLARTDYAGKPLVSEVLYHPSRQSRLYWRHAALSDAERGLAAGIVAQTQAVDGPQLGAMPIERQHAVIDTLLEYYQFHRERSKGSTGSVMPAGYVAALKQRFTLPPGEVVLPPATAVPPDQGRPPSYVQLGVAHKPGAGNEATIRIRPAYYDAMDSSGNQPQNSALSMFDTYLTVDHGHARLRRLDLFAIDSMNTAVTGLPGDRSDGWRFRVGWEERMMRAQGDKGLGHEFRAAGITTTAYGGGALQAGAGNGQWGFARVGASLLYRKTRDFSLRVNHEWRRHLGSQANSTRRTELEARYALGSAYDLRLHWESETAKRLVFGVGHYW